MPREEVSQDEVSSPPDLITLAQKQNQDHSLTDSFSPVSKDVSPRPLNQETKLQARARPCGSLTNDVSLTILTLPGRQADK